ncbi:hypothetical protein ACVOPT_002861 [Enterobacter hormaechei]
MKSAVKIHPYTHKLLTENDFVFFSVNQLRDALLELTNKSTHKDEARRFVCRQLQRLEALGLVRKIEGGGPKKRYEKTDIFERTKFVTGKIPKNSCLTQPCEKVQPAKSDDGFFLNDIKKDKSINEAKLAVVLGEIEEYRSLMDRFPQRKKYLMDLMHEAKNQSADLLGRVTALSKVLELLDKEIQVC